MGEGMAMKYGHLMVLGAFPVKITPDNRFTNEAVHQFDDSSCENTIVGDGNQQMITNKF